MIWCIEFWGSAFDTYCSSSIQIEKENNQYPVRPHIEYANQVWSPYLLKHIRALENVQRGATKLIPGYKAQYYKEHLHILNLPTLSFRQFRGDMI